MIKQRNSFLTAETAEEGAEISRGDLYFSALSAKHSALSAIKIA